MAPQIRLTQRDPNTTPLPYTAAPLSLLWSDICLFIRYAWVLPALLFPLRLGQTDVLDELYPSFQGVLSLIMQAFLTIYQLLFLLSLPFVILFLTPALWMLFYIAAAIIINYTICLFVLNGFQRVLVSNVPVAEQPHHGKERWFFINGIASGRYWTQNTVNQLSYTFGRKITGGWTYQADLSYFLSVGLPFDLIECLIQRDLTYATGDIRRSYVLLKEALLDPAVEKVVLILHSQGGIEGGLVIDWLLDELPQDLLHQLEVYTFGNAANHFNNPQCTFQGPVETNHSGCAPSVRRSIRYIEHYANSRDTVSRVGVLRFAYLPNRYLGRLFIRPGSGHLMNQHYLDSMFTLGADGRVLESNPFMDMEVETKPDVLLESSKKSLGNTSGHKEETLSPIAGSVGHTQKRIVVQDVVHQVLRVKDFSRLWRYRDGRSPETQEAVW
ncbi:uncharacterized protein N7482_006303 [Penicillium canariense]|uniref:Uncharacterized protein n=1 Tax=Penicillium canariense TaxID=189055 RepID=A0A9W9I9S1_9EURO|nr:uncharacterized protein N7482_006303 [Penicillium canariense]KAJ5167522.1 hypothetical protein N7482_006303 [Penicillium canariense]